MQISDVENFHYDNTSIWGNGHLMVKYAWTRSFFFFLSLSNNTNTSMFQFLL